MNSEIRRYKECEQAQWDDLVAGINGATYYHQSYWLEYLSAMENVVANESFILCSGGVPSAVCSLGFTRIDGQDCVEASFGGAPCSAVGVRDLPPSTRRKLTKAAYALVHEQLEAYGAYFINMVQHPITAHSFQTNIISSEYAFDALRFDLIPEITNTLVLHLNWSEEELTQNLAKYQRRHIRRGEKNKLAMEIIDKKVGSKVIQEYTDKLQLAHFIAAGRATRPQATWDAIRDAIVKGHASLFVARHESSIVSYLLCGEFQKMAFGWSQVNMKEFERELSPRHFLEWQAILHYRKAKFVFYEIGERYHSPNLFHLPTEKEISISVFKERYGGIPYPKIHWHGYCEKVMLLSELEEKFRTFVTAVNPFDL